MNTELLDIVDLNNQVIGTASRKDIYQKLLPHRIVHILITDKQNRFALQLVPKHKPPYPEHWGTSVGGHVQAGESYEQAAYRELLEEFGVEQATIIKFADLQHTTPLGQLKFIRVFTAKNIDRPLAIDPNETEKVEYFSLEEIKERRRNGEKFSPELAQIIDECL